MSFALLNGCCTFGALVTYILKVCPRPYHMDIVCILPPLSQFMLDIWFGNKLMCFGPTTVEFYGLWVFVVYMWY